jgi:uncharacterized membrane protein YvlD (DUF360 family)
MERAAIVGRGNGDGLHSQLAARTEHAQRDLPAVRHEQLPDHERTVGRERSPSCLAGGPRRCRLAPVIRLIVRTAITLAGNAVGLIVASLVLDEFAIDITGFILALIIFTVTLALMTPFLSSILQRNRSSSSALGGVALISTFVALLVTDLLSDGLSISGVGTWIAATVIVWLGALIAIFILPYLGLKKYLNERRD